jgi:hypothetical protein
MSRRRTVTARIARPVAVAIAALGALLMAAAPAHAGGPTSVLVVDHDGSRAAAAVIGSPAYDDLARALDALSGAAPSGTRAAPAEFIGTELRLVWMVHDVNPWRIDALRLTKEGIWVNTVVSWEGDLFDRSGSWHRPKDEALLRRTLTALGVLGAGPVGTEAAVGPVPRTTGAPVRGVSAPPPSASQPLGPSGASLGTLAWAALATFVLGLLSGRLTRRHGPERGAGSHTRRSVDAEAGPHTTAPDADPRRGAESGPTASGPTPLSRFSLR